MAMANPVRLAVTEPIDPNAVDRQVKRDPLPIIPLGWDPATNFGSGGMVTLTWSYFDPSEVSSACQKAVRRGYSLETVQWAMELFWTNRHRRTNIWNRCLVMAVEDIGPADPSVVIHVLSLYLHYPEDPNAMVTAALLLAQAPKTRVNDWAVHLYGKMRSTFEQNEEETITIKQKLIDSLQRKDICQVILWTDILTYTAKKTGPTRAGIRYTNAQWYIWEAYEEITNNNPYMLQIEKIGLLNNWRWQGKSRLLYTHLAHLWCNNRLPITVSTDHHPLAGVSSLVERFALHRRQTDRKY